MNRFYDFGIQVIMFLQGLGDWMIFPMKFFTTLGIEKFYLLVTPALYWCIDTTIGIRVAMMLMFSSSINNYGKWLFHSPRPYWVSPKVKAYGAESSFGIPSGHAQNSVTIWGIIAASFRRKWIWGLTVALMFLIGISRLFLGVHFPQDVLAGWLLGVIVLWVFIKLEPTVLCWIEKRSLPNKIAIFFVISMAMILVAALVLFLFRGWTLPATWVENAALAFPNAEPIDPIVLSGEVTVAAAFFGLATGHILLFGSGGFDPQGIWWKRMLRYLLGVIGIVVLWAGLDAIFPEGDTFVAYSFRYLRYGLVGLWVTLGGPKLFIKFSLAESTQS